MKDREPRVFLWTVTVLAAVYLALRYALPHVAVWIGLTERPAPVPGFAMVIYLVCSVVGALVYLSSDDRRWRLFLGPVVRLFVLAPGPGQRARLLVLGLLPVAAGWVVWDRVMPGADVPRVIRLQHPTMPEAYAGRTNPFRELSPVERREAAREGAVLYQTNCRPCHGVTAGGDGPLARGLRLRPVDFTDPGAIASVVEAYAFWRVREGHAGLPAVAAPWNSAMPAWQEQLSDEEIWKIILAEYRIAGTEPRRPEGTDR